MASACCIHQISGPPLGSNQLKQQQHATPASLRTWRYCSYSHRRLLIPRSAPVIRTIATTPDSAIGASDAQEGESATESEQEQQLEKKDEEEAPQREPKLKKKSLIHILETLHKQAIEAATKDREIPDIRPGYVVQIRLEVPETKRRVSLLRGIVICRRNNGVNTTFTIRRIFAGVGVEMVFPLYSPSIKEIRVLAKKKVRRAKLYYLRKKLARFSTF